MGPLKCVGKNKKKDKYVKRKQKKHHHNKYWGLVNGVQYWK